MKIQKDKLYSPKVIQIFYILLPLVEVITTYMVMFTETPFTLGMVYKILFLIYCLGYLIFIDKKQRLINFAILLFFTISIVFNLFVSLDNYSLTNILYKLTSMAKYICFPISMFFLYKYTINGNKIHLKTLVYSATIYATIMLIAQLTGTQIPTYESAPDFGHSGWLYSGNEISALMAMFYPIIIYFASKYNRKPMIYSLVIVTFGLLAIGTKTSFVAILLTIIMSLIYSLFRYGLLKSELSKNMLYITFILLIVLIGSAKYSPSLSYMIERFNIAQNKSTEIEDKKTGKQVLIDNFVFNGRSEYLATQSKIYKDASIQEKLFGLKDNSKIENDEGDYNIVERDFHDILFIYGIVGLIIYFIPMILILLRFIIKLIRDFKNEANEKNFAICISIALTLGISYIAGHVLLAPTVALFLSVIFSKLNSEDVKQLDCE